MSIVEDWKVSLSLCVHVCVCVGMRALAQACVCYVVLSVVKFSEQTLLAALHSNQITRQGVQRI